MPTWPRWPDWPRWPGKKRKLDAEAQFHLAMAEKAKKLEMLQEMVNDSMKKASQEVELAKEFIRAKNEEAANQCLKRKMLHDWYTEVLGDLQYQVLDQQMTLVLTKATIETLDSLRTGAAAQEAMQKANNIGDTRDVRNEMNKINKRRKIMEQIEKVVSASDGAAAFSDKDKLEAELEKLKGRNLE